MKEKTSSKKYLGFTDLIKAKLIEAGSEYFKENIDKTKKQVFNYVEKNFEKKIKKEIKKSLVKVSSYFVMAIGIFFLIYGGLAIINQLLHLPQFMTTIFFGILLLVIGFIIWLN